VVKDTGYEYPYSSTVDLVSGEIGDDLTHYLVSSEQTPSALLLGVFVNKAGVAASGGLLLQVLPKAAQDAKLVELLDSRVSSLTGFTPLLRQGKSLSQILQDLLGDLDLDIFPETQLVRFQCSCSFDRVLGALKMLGEVELKDMIAKDNGAEATCHFCSQTYQADRHQLAQIIDDLRADAIS
jgi:molecular chaperone Hsp33